MSFTRATVLGLLLGGCATDERSMPACLAHESPTPELVMCVDRTLAPLRAELVQAYERSEAKYKNDPVVLNELYITRTVKDLNDRVLCNTDAELAVLRKAEAGGSYSKLEVAQLFLACQKHRLEQRISELNEL